MKLAKQWRSTLTVLAVISLASHSVVVAAPPMKSTQRRLVDVALQADGMLQGKLIDPRGKALVKREVAIHQDGRRVASAHTDTQGHFAVRGLRGGIYQVVTQFKRGNVRIWSEHTGPPAARSALLLVDVDRPVVRGQNVRVNDEPWFRQSWVRAVAITGGMAGTTLGVIALTEDDRYRGS